MTIRVGADGRLSSHVTPAKSIPLTEVNRAARQAAARQRANKLPTWKVPVLPTVPVVGQSWEIDLPVSPLHLGDKLDACHEACLEATVHDMESFDSFELFLERVMSLLDCDHGSQTGANVLPAQPATQMDAEWPRSDPSADRAWPVQPVVGQDRPQQEQLRWTFGGFVGGILPSGLSHPQSQQTPYPLSRRKQAIAPHAATGRH